MKRKILAMKHKGYLGEGAGKGASPLFLRMVLGVVVALMLLGSGCQSDDSSEAQSGGLKHLLVRKYIVHLIQRHQWDALTNQKKYRRLAQRYRLPLWQSRFEPVHLNEGPETEWTFLLPYPGSLYDKVAYAMLGDTMLAIAMITDQQAYRVQFWLYHLQSGTVRSFSTQLTCPGDFLTSPIYLTGADSFLVLAVSRCATLWKIPLTGTAQARPLVQVNVPGYQGFPDRPPHYQDLYYARSEKTLYVATITHSFRWDSNLVRILACSVQEPVGCQVRDSFWVPFDLQCGPRLFTFGNAVLGSGSQQMAFCAPEQLCVFPPYSPVIIRRYYRQSASQRDTVDLPRPTPWSLYAYMDSSYRSDYRLKSCGRPERLPPVTYKALLPGLFRFAGLVKGYPKHLVVGILNDTLEGDTVPVPLVYEMEQGQLHLRGLGAARFGAIPFLRLVLTKDEFARIADETLTINTPLDFISLVYVNGYGNCLYVSKDTLLCFALYPKTAHVDADSLTVRVRLGDIVPFTALTPKSDSSRTFQGKWLFFTFTR